MIPLARIVKGYIFPAGYIFPTGQMNIFLSCMSPSYGSNTNNYINTSVWDYGNCDEQTISIDNGSLDRYTVVKVFVRTEFGPRKFGFTHQNGAPFCLNERRGAR